MSDTRLSYHRCKFENEILVKKQEPKCRIWDKEDINRVVEQLCDQNGTFLRVNRSLKQFRVLESIGIKELRYIEPYSHASLQVVELEDLFNQLYWAWEQTGFAGWKPLHHKLREQGLYISMQLVRLFLEHNPCHQARISKKSQKSLVTNPILSFTFGARGQVDLIDMRTIPDDNYKWILNYQDHFTKWVVLKPLSKKCAEEVASTLVATFYTLGAPNILQSDNGKEFDNTLLFETLHILWPSTKIIHGKPRNPQSQGSVENANCRVENNLQSVLDREGHSHWAKELDRVAYLKNTTLHTVLNNSPYKVLYGRDPPRGLRDFDIPASHHPSVNTTEDISQLLPNFQGLFDNEDNARHTVEVSTSYNSNATSLILSTCSSECDSDIPEETESDNYDLTMNFSPTKLGATVNHLSESKSCSICNLSVGSETVSCFSCFTIGHKHCFSEDLESSHYFCTAPQCSRMLTQNRISSVARRGQKRKAEKMLSDTAKYLPVVSIGDNVRVSIPKVDRGKLGDKHILGVIAGKSGIFFTIGTKDGMINRKYTRGEFELWNGSSFLQVSDIPKNEYSMRTISRSVTLGRRMSCQCKGKCITKYCSCRRSGHACSSGCHSKIRGKCNNTNSPHNSPDKQYRSGKCISVSKRKVGETSFNDDDLLEVVDSSDSESIDHLINDTCRLNVSITEVEKLCVNWGGCYKDIKMVNTCSVDNFLTLISLHLNEIQEVLARFKIPINENMKKILAYIGMLKFDSLRFWIACRIAIKCENNQLNFFGSENNIVQALVNTELSIQEYHCTFECPQCSKHFTKKTRITYFVSLITNFQDTIDTKVMPKVCKICRWNDTHFKKISSNFPKLSPMLIIEAGNLQMNESLIDEYLNMEHDNELLTFKHIGHTLIYGIHFNLKTYVNEELVSYDGMRHPKIQIEEQSKFPSTMFASTS